MKLRIAIIGAGISGLMAGCLLKKLGHKVEVFEKASSISEFGAGITLSRNATTLLKREGILSGLEGLSQKPMRSIIRDYKSAKEIASKDLKGLIACDRRDLVGLLSNSLLNEGGELFLSKEVTGVNSESGELFFKNKDRINADLILACDGIRSITRSNNFKESNVRFSGYIAWRGIVDSSDLSNSKHLDNINIYYGPGGHAVHYPIGQKGKINFIAIQASPSWLEESWKIHGEKAVFLEGFKNWTEDLLRIFNASRQVYKWGIFDRSQTKILVNSKLALLGDAAHPMVPFMGQGACMAIEDAYTLSKLIEKNPNDLDKTLKCYQNLRMRRVNWMQARSRFQGKFNHISNPLLVSTRNFVTKMFISRNIEAIHSYDADQEIAKI